MRVYYDWEFLEDGWTIEPVSLGMVDEAGRELYAVFHDMPVGRILAHPWVRENVWPHLPRVRVGTSTEWLDRNHPDVKETEEVAKEVQAFLERAAPVELWGYYAAYDHVRLAQLWGAMIDRPPAMPMFTHDIMQSLSERGLDESVLPPQPKDAHNSLVDARWTRDAFNVIWTGNQRAIGVRPDTGWR